MKRAVGADNLNTEAQPGCSNPGRGGIARPTKRKKGFHRALKRKEVWALLEQGTRNIINQISNDLYNPRNNAEITADILRRSGT